MRLGVCLVLFFVELSKSQEEYLELAARVRELQIVTERLEQELATVRSTNDRAIFDDDVIYSRHLHSWAAYEARKNGFISRRGRKRRLENEDGSSVFSTVDEICNSLDTAWLIVASLICFLLQAGFGLLEVGAVRSKNAKSVLLKNTFDACAGGLAYYCFGWALSRGDIKSDERAPKAEFASDKEFMLLPDSHIDSYELFFFQLVFATTVATIVSGAVCERIRFTAYLVFTICFVGIIYPLSSHWTWSKSGYLYQAAVSDFAGGGTVHCLAGAASLVGAAIVGPREDFEPPASARGNSFESRTKGHDATLSALGVFFIWFALIPFNAGSAYGVCGAEAGRLTARVAVITLLSGCSGGGVSLIFGLVRERHISLEYGQYGVLSGLVSVASCCAVVEPWCAFWIVAPLAVMLFWFLDIMQKKYGIDDPLRASSVHWGSGAISLLAVGFFAAPKHMSAVYLNGYNGSDDKCNSLEGLTTRLDASYRDQVDTVRAKYRFRRKDTCRDFYGIVYGGSGLQLAWQTAALALYTGWAIVTSALVFGTLRYLEILRVPLEGEVRGLDITFHGGDAYAWTAVERRLHEAERRRAGDLSMAGHHSSSSGNGPPAFVGPPVSWQRPLRPAAQFDFVRSIPPSLELARIDENQEKREQKSHISKYDRMPSLQNDISMSSQRTTPMDEADDNEHLEQGASNQSETSSAENCSVTDAPIEF